MIAPCPGDPKPVWTKWFISQLRLKKPTNHDIIDSKYNQIIWINPRPHNGFQVRTLIKNILLENNYKFYTIKSNNEWTSRTIVLMSFAVKSPWYINNRTNHLMVLDDYFASVLSLFNGDVSRCLESLIS